MKTFRFLPLALLLALLLLAAGCGGGSKSVPPTAVAVVGSQTITKTEFNSLFDSARSQYQAKKTPFPKPGTTQYKQLQDRALGYLVEISEFEQKAKDLGITITPKDVNARLALIKKQVGGTDKAYRAQLKASGITEKQLLQNIHANLLSEKLYAKVTAKTTVSNDEIKTYYAAHKSAYGHAASRDIRHILVNSEKLAKDIIQQLKGGADFAKLAKKYSKDPGSAANGGKLTITKGQTVAEFDKTAFALQTNQLSGPVKTTYGYHIIQPISKTVAWRLQDLRLTQRWSSTP